ncbi:MAG: 50S ribosomal protein L23 [Pseudomonadota bacterium]|nr:50S ribosomal protein L23 [Pseudomonadota bacterium]
MSKTQATEGMYTVLKRPLITEKTAQMSTAGNWYAFEVDTSADKPAIKRAVEAVYNVKVDKVNTSNLNGKVKRFRGGLGRRNDVKKAFIRLAAGQTLDVSAGV